MSINDLTGKRFGRLTAVRIVGRSSDRKCLWECKCDCANVVNIPSNKLVTLHTQSCGCYRRDKTRAINRKHGMSKTPIYQIWSGMFKRCYNKKTEFYYCYGGRGITVCNRWRVFTTFYEDIGKDYKKGLSIDRINNDGNYEPSNCRWATPPEQARNKQNTRILTVDGVSKTLTDWAKDSGIPITTIHSRLNKLKWPVRDAVRAEVIR